MPLYSTALFPYESFFYCILGSYFRDWTDFWPLADPFEFQTVQFAVTSSTYQPFLSSTSENAVMEITGIIYGACSEPQNKKNLTFYSWHFFSLINSLSRFNLGTRVFRIYNFNCGNIYFFLQMNDYFDNTQTRLVLNLRLRFFWYFI